MRRYESCSLLAVLVLLASLLSACGGRGQPPQQAVEDMYAALEQGDMDAYLDTILPENRRQPNPMGLLNALSIGVGMGMGGLNFGIDLSQLMKVSIRDLKVTTIRVQGDYALVQAEGNVRYPILLMEVPFCDQHDVRRRNGKWYVDVYAPERQERLQRILALRQQELEQMTGAAPPQTGQLEVDLQNMLSLLGSGVETVLDLCE